jgi:hypothetical protein
MAETFRSLTIKFFLGQLQEKETEHCLEAHGEGKRVHSYLELLEDLVVGFACFLCVEYQRRSHGVDRTDGPFGSGVLCSILYASIL